MWNGTNIVEALGLEREIARLRNFVAEWVESCHSEMRPFLRWQFEGRSKHFRPATIFSCHLALGDGQVTDRLVRSAVALELFHNVALVIDDILDRSTKRRGKRTLHCQFGRLPALMASGYTVAEAYRMVTDDPFDIERLSELLRRLGVAECMQWRLRRRPLGVEDWRTIAGEDTGSMFEACACLGTRNDHLRRFGHLLGLLYHGCDDVGDVRGAEALGGGGAEDLRDGILTLPVALAIRDPAVAEMYIHPDSANELDFVEAIEKSLPEAEDYLDRIAQESRREAETFAPNAAPLILLVDYTRELSRQ